MKQKPLNEIERNRARLRLRIYEMLMGAYILIWIWLALDILWIKWFSLTTEMVIALILPKPYNFVINIDIKIVFLFLITFVLGIILMISLVLFYHILCLITLDEKGIINMLMVLADILSGLTIPIPFFPLFLQKISNILPFRYISDLPFRVFVGNIGIKEGLIGIVFQIIWIIILVLLGKIIMKKALRKAVIQGG